MSKSKDKRLAIQKGEKMEIKDFEIYFDDLNENTQKELLEYMEIDSPEQLNLDSYPLAVLTKPEEAGDAFPAG